MADYMIADRNPSGQELTPKTTTIERDGVRYTVTSLTARCHLLELTDTGEFVGQFASFDSIRRFLTYALEATH